MGINLNILWGSSFDYNSQLREISANWKTMSQQILNFAPCSSFAWQLVTILRLWIADKFQFICDKKLFIHVSNRRSTTRTDLRNIDSKHVDTKVLDLMMFHRNARIRATWKFNFKTRWSLPFLNQVHRKLLFSICLRNRYASNNTQTTKVHENSFQ